MQTRKRLLSLLLCGAILFSLCSPSSFAEAQTIQDSGQITADADGLCEHHTEHTPDCVCTEGEPETPCTHEHTEDCYSYRPKVTKKPTISVEGVMTYTCEHCRDSYTKTVQNCRRHGKPTNGRGLETLDCQRSRIYVASDWL